MALIESTKDGRPLYRVRWNYRRINGKSEYDERRFRNKQEARQFASRVTSGHTTDTETITVEQLAGLWFDRHVDVNLQKRTRLSYRLQYEHRIKPALGTRRISKLTPRMLADWRDWMTERTGARTVNMSIDTLKAMIRWGRSEGLCANDWVDHLRRVKTPPPKRANPYPPEKVEAIRKGCEHMRDATLVVLAAYSGLRWSELRALRWSDIDLESGCINLSRALDVDYTTKDTKTAGGRTVPILKPGLEQLRKWRAVAPDTALVFTNTRGNPIRDRAWYTDRLPRIREACGINFDLHELRDTYASILIQSGIGEAELTLWLGHTSIQQTLDRYGRLFERRKTLLVEKANAALEAMSAPLVVDPRFRAPVEGTGTPAF